MDTIPGRKKEIKVVSNYIEYLKMGMGLGERTPLCMNGSPGCGKTTIIQEALSYLETFPH